MGRPRGSPLRHQWAYERDDGYSGSQPFASATYTPAGQISTLTCGPGTEQRTYNNLLQVVHQLLPGYMDTTYNYIIVLLKISQ